MAVLDTNQMMFTAFEPIVANRHIMYIDGIPSYLIKKVTAPNFDAGEIKLDHINVYRKIKGKINWGDMNISLYNPIAPSGAQAVMEWARLGYEYVTGRAGYFDFYSRSLTFKAIDPVGSVVNEWIIKYAYIKNAKLCNCPKTNS